MKEEAETIISVPGLLAPDCGAVDELVWHYVKWGNYSTKSGRPGIISQGSYLTRKNRDAGGGSSSCEFGMLRSRHK